MNCYRKFDDSYDVYYPLHQNDLPKTIELDGKKYYRFMNYFYIPKPVYELDEYYVKFINDLRYNFKDLVIDNEYNTIIEYKIFNSIMDYVQLNGPIKLLDFGCGEGALGNFLKEKIKTDKTFNLYGVDIRDIDRNLLFNYKSFHLVSLSQELPFDDHYFDIVIALFVFHFRISNVQLESLYRSLKKGGLLWFNLIDSADRNILNRIEQVGFKQKKRYREMINDKYIEYYIYDK